MSTDWKRIDALPIRCRPDDVIEDLRHRMTKAFRTAGGEQTLLPLQAAALADWFEGEGYCGWLPVGSGKTLVSLLAGNFFDHDRILLMVPASLRAKTTKAMRDARVHWRFSDKIIVKSYESLQTVKGANLLERIEPDIVICDEAAAFRNPKAARTRRFMRYMSARPSVRLMLLDGSLASRSILDYWHLTVLALRMKAPLPVRRGEAERWASSLDAGSDELHRPPAGALRLWCSAEKQHFPDLTVAREGFRARTACSPGYMVGGDTVVSADLVLRERRLTLDKGMQAALDRLESRWETENGDVITDALTMRRHQRELLTGFWYKWDPAPPDDWMEARREWNQFVRAQLAQDVPGLDSPLQVARAFPHDHRLAHWRSVKDTFTINTVPVWVSDIVVDDIARWLEEHRGIAWVEHKALGERLSTKTGYRYFADGKLDAREILSHSGPFIASVACHHKGKDLQHLNRNLVVTPPSCGRKWEQLMGRTHRQGQQEDTVFFDMYAFHDCHLRALDSALDSALFLEQTSGPQRLLRAQKIISCLT